MKKSLFIFGLLASTLVMLSAIPLLNYNNSAMAQGYNIIRDNNYYSQYPTEDKKYECRTGPFEGFFVSSVEFCKNVKFDKDRKDIRDNNQTGTQGPPGPAGPSGATGATGATGARGPSGITELNATNTYPESLNFTRNANFISGFADCDEGDIVINGGYNVILNEPSTVFLTLPIQDFAISPATWEVFAGLNETVNATLIVNVLCFDNPPLRP